MSDQLVTSENLTTELLKSMFDDAYMNTSLDSEGDLVVKDGFKCFVLPSKDKARISLMILVGPKDNATLQQKLELANRINNGLYVVKAIVTDSGNFQFETNIPVEGGITKKAIVLATKFFMMVVSDGVINHDEEDIL